jgi:hypothetical protein
MGWELWLFLGVEGLDTQIYWGFRGKKMRGSLHCGFASGRDDGGGGWGGEQTTARAKAKCGGPSTARFALRSV